MTDKEARWDWHPWFAWYPVEAWIEDANPANVRYATRTKVWLRWVERRWARVRWDREWWQYKL